jgi:IS30 family transposase
MVLPQGTNFQLLSQGPVIEVPTCLNDTPQKVLGYQSPQRGIVSKRFLFDTTISILSRAPVALHRV